MSRRSRRLSKQERQEQIVAELHIRPAIRAWLSDAFFLS
jgi:hypothetical protein